MYAFPQFGSYVKKSVGFSWEDYDIIISQWSTGGRILTGAGAPQFSRGRGWPLKLDRGRGRGTHNVAGAGAGGSIPKCSQKLKPEFDNNLENCMLYFQYLNVLNVYNTFLNFEILQLSLYCVLFFFKNVTKSLMKSPAVPPVNA